MGKKKINIILILVVLGLWGTVGYKTVNRYFGNNKSIFNTEEIQNREISLKKIHKDTFELERVSLDPFLNKHISEKPTITVAVTYHAPIKKPIGSSSYVPKIKSIVNWPELQYFGYLKSNNQELVLLKIESKLHKLKLNDPVNGLVVKKKFKDSIEVSFHMQSRIIHIK